MHNNNHTPDPQESKRYDLLEYRIAKLEEAVTRLSLVSEVVLKWDARFSSSEHFLQCPMHKMKMDGYDLKFQKIDEDISSIKKFMYQATGALVIISIVFQFFGPMVFDAIRSKPEVHQVEKH